MADASLPLTPPPQAAPTLLGGYRILECTDALAVYGTRLLADVGAEVIKLEPPQGDPLRHEPPFYPALPHPEHSLTFMAWNTNKKSLTLNLLSADGQAILHALLPSVDALVVSGPVDDPGLRLLRDPALRQAHPHLVVTTASGFGLDGPHAAYRTSDLIAQAMGGVMWMSGAPERPPTRPGGNLADLLCGLYVAAGTMVALWHRQNTGEGQVVDVSQQDCVASILAEFGAASYWATEAIPQRYGTHRPDFFPNGVYPCRDGYLMLIVLPTDWQRFARWVHDVTGDHTVLEPRFELNETRILPASRAVLNPIIEAFTRHFDSKDTLFHEGQKRHFLFAPVNTVADLLQDRHLQARGFWQALQLPGLPPLTAAGCPLQSTVTCAVPLQPAPRLGQHNLEIYAGELGLSPRQLAALKEHHVI